VISLAAMLTEIELKNFRAHVDTRVPLERFTLLVGDNASGKTSVLAALRLVAALYAKFSHGEVLTGADALPFIRRHGAREPLELAVRANDAKAWTWRVVVPPGDVNLAFPTYAYQCDGDPQTGALQNVPRPTPATPAFPPSMAFGVPPAMLRFNTDRLAEASTSDETVPTLDEDGYGLATVLKHLKSTEDDHFDRIVAATRAVVPSLRAVSFQRVKRERAVSRILSVEGRSVTVPETLAVIADELMLRFADTDFLPAHAASEGTLLALGTLTRLYASPSPRVVLIDDIDRALHPRAQGEFIAALRAALAFFPEMQIVATTHSPYLADHFEPASVVVLGRPDEGPIVARRLSEHADQKLLAAMTTGEFLTASGAGWFGP
jgi:AAA domain, putative AbiEii toxin, Type IV TA system/AAA ATPase domain